MAASLQVSAYGLKSVDASRKLKGWKKLDEDWAEQAGVSTTTLRRFWEGRRIRQAHFKAICQAVGVENWETMVDKEALVCSGLAQPVVGKDAEKEGEERIAGAIASGSAQSAIATSSQPYHEAFAARPVALDSPFYVERPPIESNCYNEIREPGALIRIKALRQMGKTSLINRILAQAALENYRTVRLNLRQAERTVLSNIDKFLRWFCANVSQQLQLEPRLDDYWDEELMGSLVSCTTYFQAYLLEQISCPLVLSLDEVERIFEYPDIAQDFFPLLRNWYEEANNLDIWKLLRLVVVHSTEVYIPLKINQSPFNVGLPVELPEFSLEQVADLAQRHGLDWTEHQLKPLMAMLGGHPFLVRLALYQISRQEIALEQLLLSSPTESGIFIDHLRRHLVSLQQNPELAAAFKKVVTTDASVQLEPMQVYRLQRMGLVQLDGNKVMPRCNLYRQYFRNSIGSEARIL
jgi:DNA-binding Xre family transcriptional regulator